MLGEIRIKNKSAQCVEIDIEGVIGVPEQWQFEQEQQRVATYEKFSSVIAQISKIETRSIVVNIRSTGGDVNDALLIHDTLRSLSAQITTRCYGYVASAATIIAQAASKNCREISSNALYLIHRAISSTEGNVNTLSEMVELLDQTDQRIASIYATRSGKAQETFAALMSENNGNGRWLSPSEAMEAGLADRVIESSPISNNAAEMIEQLGLPAIPEANQMIENPKKQTTMNITKRWNAMLEILGFAPAGQTPLSESNLDTIESELESRSGKIVDLQNKVVTLETENARLKAEATTTKPKEDPAPTEYKRSSNDEAYNADVTKFK